MEKIIQIAVDQQDNLIALTSDGRIFQQMSTFNWEELHLPPLHTNEIDHTNKSHSCAQCVEVNAQNILTNNN